MWFSNQTNWSADDQIHTTTPTIFGLIIYLVNYHNPLFLHFEFYYFVMQQNQNSWSPWASPTSTQSSKNPLGSKNLKDFSVQDSSDFLSSIGLEKYSSCFRDKGVDGTILGTLTHPAFGNVMLDSMGFTPEDKKLLIEAIYKHQVQREWDKTTVLK